MKFWIYLGLFSLFAQVICCIIIVNGELDREISKGVAFVGLSLAIPAITAWAVIGWHVGGYVTKTLFKR